MTALAVELYPCRLPNAAKLTPGACERIHADVLRAARSPQRVRVGRHEMPSEGNLAMSGRDACLSCPGCRALAAQALEDAL